MNIPERIRELRKAKGLSQEAVARRADMSLNGYANIERGLIPDPHISSLAQIANALSVPVSDLVATHVVQMQGFEREVKPGQPTREEILRAISEIPDIDEATAEMIADKVLKAVT